MEIVDLIYSAAKKGRGTGPFVAYIVGLDFFKDLVQVVRSDLY